MTRGTTSVKPGRPTGSDAEGRQPHPPRPWARGLWRHVLVAVSGGSVITIGSGASSGTVSVAARTDDSYDQGTTTVTASISSATGGNFETLTVSGGRQHHRHHRHHLHGSLTG
ncbi:MAG: hypothetical protein IPN05_19780 [Sulfuritalea sp.]|nr:hypothetical protein [Sulfuritalea sp.]